MGSITRVCIKNNIQGLGGFFGLAVQRFVIRRFSSSFDLSVADTPFHGIRKDSCTMVLLGLLLALGLGWLHKMDGNGIGLLLFLFSRYSVRRCGRIWDGKFHWHGLVGLGWLPLSLF